MSLICSHLIAEARDHPDCQGCCAIPNSEVRQAIAAAEMRLDVRRAIAVAEMRLDECGRDDRLQHLGRRRSQLMAVTEYGIYARRHTACGSVVSRHYDGFSESWGCDRCLEFELRDQNTYLGFPLPPQPRTAETYDEIRAQDLWNRTQHAVTSSIMRTDWPTVLTWCLFVVSAYVSGADEEMGPYWNYMQVFCDVWSSVHV